MCTGYPETRGNTEWKVSASLLRVLAEQKIEHSSVQSAWHGQRNREFVQGSTAACPAWHSWGRVLGTQGGHPHHAPLQKEPWSCGFPAAQLEGSEGEGGVRRSLNPAGSEPPIPRGVPVPPPASRLSWLRAEPGWVQCQHSCVCREQGLCASSGKPRTGEFTSQPPQQSGKGRVCPGVLHPEWLNSLRHPDV